MTNVLYDSACIQSYMCLFNNFNVVDKSASNTLIFTDFIRELNELYEKYFKLKWTLCVLEECWSEFMNVNNGIPDSFQ